MFGGPLTPGGTPPSLASPETVSGPPTPESNTVLASPLADRMGGLSRGQVPIITNLIRKGLQALSKMIVDSDPKAAERVEKMAADLLKISVTHSQTQVRGMASALPQSGASGPIQAMPPPAVLGTGAMSGPLSGLGQ